MSQSPNLVNVAAWTLARRKHNGTVPPLSPYHPPEGSHLLFPTLTALPFHDDRSAHKPRLAEAVKLLERMAPVVQQELDG